MEAPVDVTQETKLYHKHWVICPTKGTTDQMARTAWGWEEQELESLGIHGQMEPPEGRNPGPVPSGLRDVEPGVCLAEPWGHQRRSHPLPSSSSFSHTETEQKLPSLNPIWVKEHKKNSICYKAMEQH
ncbi:hypothetical protein P7K49_022009 [Saguinus oedipus]|uniref:Uncharacterized protein n=1 Tax=Saguinus oedipus TaxID=9490 RepID=A0ABQ9UUC4_SAGOE|nr:hypothetical protein P7K49_022009 [Saguinus oedipus]